MLLHEHWRRSALNSAGALQGGGGEFRGIFTPFYTINFRGLCKSGGARAPAAPPSSAPMYIIYTVFNFHFRVPECSDIKPVVSESLECFETPPQGFKCPTPNCEKVFKRESHLNQHVKVHDNRQWECDVCKKVFTTKYFLKKHKRLHTGRAAVS